MSVEIIVPEFSTPDFLANCSTNDFHQRMKTALPADLDLSEGNHAWNLTRPTALVAAYLCEFIMPEVIRLILPEYSYGEFLEGHAKGRKITRRPAVSASGEITITGKPNTIIPKGSLFATASVNDEPSVDYVTLEDAKIQESGSVTVKIQCTKAGQIGNTNENTIIMVGGKNTGITGAINEKEITGGVEQESDEDLILRILEYDRTIGISYTGCPADYKRWAKEIPGVGEAVVISAQDDSGLVTIVLTDANGKPANDTLCNSVYDNIMRPNDPDQRPAPINANLLVIPPATINFSLRATIELISGYTIEAVRASLAKNLAQYFPQASDDAEIKYSRVAAVLSGTQGVNDYSDLQIGVVNADGTTSYGVRNIPISKAQLPDVPDPDDDDIADRLILTAGTVGG